MRNDSSQYATTGLVSGIRCYLGGGEDEAGKKEAPATEGRRSFRDGAIQSPGAEWLKIGRASVCGAAGETTERAGRAGPRPRPSMRSAGS